MIDLGIHGSSHGPVSGTDEEIRLNQTYSASAYVCSWLYTKDQVRSILDVVYNITPQKGSSLWHTVNPVVYSV